MKEKTFITVLTSESYFEGVLALNESLKRVKAKYPLTVLINNNISKETENKLIEREMKIIRKENIKLDSNITKKNDVKNTSYWNNTFDKLLIFELTEFEKLVYLDSDMYIRNNIDNLFEKDDMSAVIDKRYNPLILESWKKLNSGLMVIKPKENILEGLMEALRTVESKRETFGDQDVLQEYYNNWDNKSELHLQDIYNVFFPYLDYHTHIQNMKLEDISVVHFVFADKPWYIKGEKRVEKYLERVNNHLKEMGEREKDPIVKDCIIVGNRDRTAILEEYFEILDSANNL